MLASVTSPRQLASCATHTPDDSKCLSLAPSPLGCLVTRVLPHPQPTSQASTPWSVTPPLSKLLWSEIRDPLPTLPPPPTSRPSGKPSGALCQLRPSAERDKHPCSRLHVESQERGARWLPGAGGARRRRSKGPNSQLQEEGAHAPAWRRQARHCGMHARGGRHG